MRYINLSISLLFILLFSFEILAKSYIEKRKELDDISTQTVELLSKNNATAERELKSAFGYAVFDNSNVTVLFFGGSSGKGVLYNNKTKQRTYMKMAGANLGVGLGVKNIRIVFIFLSKEDFIRFKDNGWVGGLQADATAKSKNKGGANDVQTDMSGVQTYVMTKKGVALQVSLEGAKYWKDDALN